MAEAYATVSREFSILIDAAPDRVWAALISPEYTTEWWFANTVESSWVMGAPIRYLGEDGLPYVLGEVLTADPPRRLATTLHPDWSDDVRGHGGTRRLDARAGRPVRRPGVHPGHPRALRCAAGESARS